ncbi:hypothetical protein CHRY9390_01265 [Chryseobacterium aquaeductus]|uniref:Uncharacterized protein n=1 Tax=Chryseobacterium aquaeductus TaxID=2675056 RepID=A0A9N8MF61_9FLAO|nr:hypothetical protein CHRY9390_01265 [Chryseobacterium potabilaquae]CAD7804727.1 hypothetical protein CHRY9390_01265 [Chryseobacterium aquaeductus]
MKQNYKFYNPEGLYLSFAVVVGWMYLLETNRKKFLWKV